MAHILRIDTVETGMPDAFLHQSPRAKKPCDLSSVEEASTCAPSTPYTDRLKDLDVPEMPLSPFGSPIASRNRFPSYVSIPEEHAGAEEDADEFCISMAPLQSELGQWAQRHVEEKLVVIGMPPLQSELGQWAQRHVEEKPFVIGMPPLESVLGQWAQKLIAAEDWFQSQLCNKEYVVDGSGLWDGTTGLAYRKSKCVEDRDLDIEGPMWGTTIEGFDTGDGWLKVEHLYLPMALEGTRVLTPCTMKGGGDKCLGKVEAVYDGPALTEDGRAVDLDGGAPIFFAYDPLLAASHRCKNIMINAVKQTKRAQLARDASDAAIEVDMEAAVGIDPAGVMHGEESLSWVPAHAAKEAAAAAANRLKLFHQKRNHRNGRVGPPASPSPVLCIDPDGKVFIFLYVSKRMAKRTRRSSTEGVVGTVMGIDINGIVRDVE